MPKKTTEQFKKEVYELTGEEYTVLSEYVTARESIQMKHNKCLDGTTYKYPVTPSNFLKGRRCPKCARVKVGDKFRKSADAFKNEIYELVGEEYTLLDEYFNSWKPVQFIHNQCIDGSSHAFPMEPISFLKGKRCPKCKKQQPKPVHVRKKTTEMFKREVQELIKDEYTVLGEYKNNRTDIMMKHNNCLDGGSYEYPVRPSNFLNGTRCPKCFGTHKKITEQFKQEVLEKGNGEYEVLGEYITAHIPILIRHITCLDGGTHEYPIKPNAFLSGSRCPKCYGTPMKTDEEFKKDVYDLVGEEYIVLSEYQGNKKEVQMKHVYCWDGGTHDFPVRPGNFLFGGTRCPKCFGSFLKTIEQFKQEVFDLVGDEYQVVSEYINSREYITMLHKYCLDGGEHEYPVTPDSFLRGIRCPKCGVIKAANKLRKTLAEFKVEIFKLVGDEYSVVGDYVSSHVPILMKHNKCLDGGTNEFPMQPANFIYGQRCPKCFGNFLKTHEEFVQEVRELVGDEYTVLETYKGSKETVSMRHNTCLDGRTHEYTPFPSNFLKGQRCPKCAPLRTAEQTRKTIEQFKQEVYDLVGEEYTVEGEYTGANSSILLKHHKCLDGGSFQYPATPSNFLRGSRCPKCSQSKGEKRILDWLNNKSISFKPQYKFEDCRYKRKMPFDFAVFINENLICLIEYQGGQHYAPVDFFGGVETFEDLLIRDTIKKQYCISKGIPLLVIPYWEFDNIEEILENYFLQK
ncbi:hypothetical protein WAX78_00715 [Bacillus sp. FJAT-53711]|uniref:DUF2726 domain-containing protein n=1 Tax=Bacillus yunxiaonensis TaxID=3127665 RepID=A0ABU8FQ93_9BACI